MKQTKRPLREAVYNSNIFIVILAIALLYSTIKVGKELTRRWQINREIANLSEELSKAQGKKDQLQDLIDYLKTDKYVEEQARLQLNLSKSGEKRVDLSGDNQVIALATEQEDLANWQKWFNYFFK